MIRLSLLIPLVLILAAQPEAEDFLEAMANEGGGDFYPAASASQLLDVFQDIFDNITSTENTSFVPPAVTLSSGLHHKEYVYLPLFKPGRQCTLGW